MGLKRIGVWLIKRVVKIQFSGDGFVEMVVVASQFAFHRWSIMSQILLFGLTHRHEERCLRINLVDSLV
jgi:hypothetical protein